MSKKICCIAAKRHCHTASAGKGVQNDINHLVHNSTAGNATVQGTYSNGMCGLLLWCSAACGADGIGGWWVHGAAADDTNTQVHIT